MTTHRRQLAGLGHRLRVWITFAGRVANSAIWALAAISVASVLVAQVAPDSLNPIPVLMGAVERPDLEQQARASVPEGAFIHIYRWDGPIEPIVRYYIDHIDGHQNAPLDTAALERGRALRELAEPSAHRRRR